MNNNAFEIQNQIKQNVLQMTNHIKNLKQWETEMRDKQPEENKEAGQEVVSEASVYVMIVTYYFIDLCFSP